MRLPSLGFIHHADRTRREMSFLSKRDVPRCFIKLVAETGYILNLASHEGKETLNQVGRHTTVADWRTAGYGEQLLSPRDNGPGVFE